MNRYYFGEIYAVGWLVVLLTVSFWAGTKLEFFGLAYLVGILPVAILSA